MSVDAADQLQIEAKLEGLVWLTNHIWPVPRVRPGRSLHGGVHSLLGAGPGSIQAQSIYDWPQI